MNRTEARNWLVSGTVQGVGFRAFVLDTAVKLGLQGWTRNLDDGRVEVYAAGLPTALSELAAGLHKGPRFAQVRHVEEREDEVRTLTGFTIR